MNSPSVSSRFETISKLSLDDIYSQTAQVLGWKVRDPKDNIVHYKAKEILPLLIAFVTVEEFVDRMRQFTFEEDSALKSLEALERRGLIYRIATPLSHLKVSRLSERLVITPLGVCLVATWDLNQSIDENIRLAKETLGDIMNQIQKDEMLSSLSPSRRHLTKEEITLALLVLLTQATSGKRALIVKKSELKKYFLDPVKMICEVVFDDPKVVRDEKRLYDAIRRSGDKLRGLAAKIAFFSKEEVGRATYRLYFQIDEEEHLRLIIAKIVESVAKHCEVKSLKNLVRLVDSCMRYADYLIPVYTLEKISSGAVSLKHLRTVRVLLQNAIGNLGE